MTGTFDGEYRQVQSIAYNDTRSFEERLAALPFVRDEDLPEWEEWARRAFPHAIMYVNNN